MQVWLVAMLSAGSFVVLTVVGLGLFVWNDRRLHRQSTCHRSS